MRDEREENCARSKIDILVGGVFCSSEVSSKRQLRWASIGFDYLLRGTSSAWMEPVPWSTFYWHSTPPNGRGNLFHLLLESIFEKDLGLASNCWRIREYNLDYGGIMMTL